MRLLRGSLSCCLAFLVTGPQAILNGQCRDSPPLYTRFGSIEAQQGTQLDATHLRKTVTKNSARYIRARLHLVAKSSCAWNVTVRDEMLRPVEVFAQDRASPAGYVWTSRVQGRQATFELRGCSGSQIYPILQVDQVITMPESQALDPMAYYSLKKAGSADWTDLYDYNSAPSKPDRISNGDFVGMLMVSSGGNSVAWACSGFMLTPDLFLTNWHCGAPESSLVPGKEGDYWSDAVVESALIDLSWDTDQISRDFVVVKVEQSDPGLDFTVLRVKPLAADGPVASAPVAGWDPVRGDVVYAIHHPLGMRKQYSANCRISRTQFANWRASGRETDFTHDCDTEGASSGAPIFTSSGEVIGLHHLSYEFNTKDCSVKSENKAVTMTEILKQLRTDLKQGIVVRNKP
jgi:Trypsin-like peptidase domain